MTDTDDQFEPDPQVIPLAFERARVIMAQSTSGQPVGDVPANAAILMAEGILALTKLLEADTDVIARLVESEKRLEEERNDALTRARAAEAEQLPVRWYWSTVTISEVRTTENEKWVCRANRWGGGLQMIGMIPDQVQTACLARVARLNSAPTDG